MEQQPEQARTLDQVAEMLASFMKGFDSYELMDQRPSDMTIEEYALSSAKETLTNNPDDTLAYLQEAVDEGNEDAAVIIEAIKQHQADREPSLEEVVQKAKESAHDKNQDRSLSLDRSRAKHTSKSGPDL